MEIYAIDHVQLAMPQGGEKEARQFYGNILGLAEVSKPPQLAMRGGCWFEGNGVKVHVGVEVNFSPSRKAHPAFLVRNLNLLQEKLLKAGYKISPSEPIEGYLRIDTSDPFGNRIELMESLARVA